MAFSNMAIKFVDERKNSISLCLEDPLPMLSTSSYCNRPYSYRIHITLLAEVIIVSYPDNRGGWETGLPERDDV